MKKSVLAFLSSVIALVIVSTAMTVPAQAGPLDCSLGGSFGLEGGGLWLTSSTANCAGEVTIPAAVTQLTNNSFAGKNITKVTFEANSKLEWLNGFRNTQISSIEIPPSTTDIWANALKGTPIKSVTVPGRVRNIGAEAFPENIETLIFEPRIATSLVIGNFGLSNLQSLTLQGPSLINSLGSVSRAGLTFDGWSTDLGGPKVSFPFTVAGSSVVTLYPILRAPVVEIYNCSASGTFTTTDGQLTSSTSDCAGEVTIPESVTIIPQGVFTGRAITAVTFAPGSRLDGIAREGLANMLFTSITLPNSVRWIEANAFLNSKITSLSIPGNVYFLGDEVFGYSKVKTIVFETRINSYLELRLPVWGNAGNITSITFSGSTFVPMTGSPSYPVKNFLRWSRTPGGTSVSMSNQIQGIFYANWDPKIFTATYNSMGGSLVASGNIVGGEIQFPAPPTKTNYTFDGWYGNPELSGGQITEWMEGSNKTFFARWIRYWGADFNTRGGSAVDSVQWIEGDQISQAPASPNRPGYTFAGWSRTDGGPAISFPYSPADMANITFFAKWTANTYVANFNSQGGSPVVASSFVTAGAVSLAPAVPTRRGYTLMGWSATEGGEIVSFPYFPGVIENITLHAKWDINTYVVNLNTNGGSSVPAASFQTDGPLSTLIDTFRPGYTFLGWSATDGGAALAFPYSPGVVENITLHAIWDANTHAVTLDTKGGLPVLAVSFRTDGAIALAPTTPIRPGYTFLGWSATDGGEAVSFPYAPGVIENITLYAVWDANTYSVNLNTTGGLALPAISFRTDGNISLAPSIPVRVGYTFVGWALTNGGTAITFPFAPGVIENITLYANWTRDPFKPELIAGDVIAGTGIQSTLLSAAGGSWLAYPEAVVTHQWYRCSSAVAAGLSALPSAAKCVKITGAALPNYKVAVADAGKYLTSLVEAKNSIGTTFLTVASFRAPTLKAPTKVALPVGTGTPKASSYLTGTVGTWVGNPVPKTTVQWFRCEKATSAASSAVPRSAQCAAIRGATSTRYRLGTADKGKYVTVQITAKNTEGQAVSTAKSQRVLLDPTLVNTPEISGAAGLNKSLRVNAGTWLSYPTAKTSFQWYRCNRATQAGAKSFSGSSGCKAIAGATKSSYRTTAADEGKYISVLVKAVNTAGTKSVTTRSSEKIE